MNIIELAEQVGAVQNVLAMGRHDGVLFTETELEAFAELVEAAARANEREECAKLFDNQNIWDEEVSQTIRARGTT